MDLISRHCTPQNDIPPNALLSYSIQPTRSGNARNTNLTRARRTDQPTTYMNWSDNWAPTGLTFRNPCSHCFEWGHWAVDCPRKKGGYPRSNGSPMDQPRCATQTVNTLSSSIPPRQSRCPTPCSIHQQRHQQASGSIARLRRN